MDTLTAKLGEGEADTGPEPVTAYSHAASSVVATTAATRGAHAMYPNHAAPTDHPLTEVGIDGEYTLSVW